MADEETTEGEEENVADAAAEETDDVQADENTGDDSAADDSAADDSNGGAEPDSPEFPELKKGGGSSKVGDLNRFYDVQVTVSAELGRTSVPIQDLVGLSEGSVFELNRDIGAPIELIAQGVPLGNGEVVVVDDSFAIRIKEIYSDKN
jgi:flagellar motor switch protein FliN/FliY